MTQRVRSRPVRDLPASGIFAGRARLRWSGLAARLNTPLACATCTAVCYLALVLVRLSLCGNDPSAFVMAGDRFADPAHVPPGLTVAHSSWGFDGQYYYALSLDPLSHHRTIGGIRSDNPPYRQQRILYPALVWLLSAGGHARLVPTVMILVNLVAVTLLGLVGALWARSFGRHAAWGLLLPFYPGFALTVGLDVPEALSALCVAGGLLLILRRQRPLLGGLLLAGAALTRETAILVAAGVMLAWAARKLRSALSGRARGEVAPPWYAGALPLAAFAAWQFVIWLWWKRLPFQTGGGNMTTPLYGFVRLLQFISLPVSQTQRTIALELLFVIAFLAAGALALRPVWRMLEVKLGWALYLAIALTLAPMVWISAVGFMRVLAEAYVLSAILALGLPSRVRHWFAALTGGAWLYLAWTVATLPAWHVL